MVVRLTQALERRDPATRGHAARVAKLAEAVARRLGWAEERLEVLRLGAALHDVGKLAVPREVLTKAGPLTRAELDRIRRHPAAGALMIGPIAALHAALPYVLYHHARWDGRGYPSGRRGDEIPEEARLLALADAFDAMISTRPYRPARPLEHALAEIARCAGTQFDPRLAVAFLAVWDAARDGRD